MSNNGKTTSEIEREVESKRADVEETLDALRAKMSVGQILDEAGKSLKVGEGAEFFNGLGRQVRDNPVPAAIAAVGLGWLMVASGRSVREVRYVTREREDFSYDPNYRRDGGHPSRTPPPRSYRGDYGGEPPRDIRSADFPDIGPGPIGRAMRYWRGDAHRRGPYPRDIASADWPSTGPGLAERAFQYVSGGDRHRGSYRRDIRSADFPDTRADFAERSATGFSVGSAYRSATDASGDAYRSATHAASDAYDRGRASAAHAYDAGAHSAERAYEAASGTATSVYGTVRDAASGLVHGVGSAASSVADAATRAAGAVSSAASTVGGAVGSAASTTATVGSGAYRGARRVGNVSYAAARRGGYGAMRYGTRARRGFYQVMDDEPLLVGAIGLAIGAAIGLSMPRTETEDRYIGPYRDTLRDDAESYAREQYGRAREMAGSAYEGARGELDRQGLSPSGLSGAVDSLVEKGKRIAEAAVDAASDTRTGDARTGDTSSSTSSPASSFADYAADKQGAASKSTGADYAAGKQNTAPKGTGSAT